MTTGAPSSARPNARAPKGLFGFEPPLSPLQRAIDQALQNQKRKLEQTRSAIAAHLGAARLSTPMVRPVVGERIRAALSGAGDAVTLGVADPAIAAARAAVGSGGTFSKRYADELEKERVRDRQDAKEYPVSRAIGQTAGTVGAVAGLAAMAPVGAAAGAARAGVAVTRLAPNVGHVVRLGAAGGAGTGLASQVAADVLSGRISSPQEFGGAVAGGAIGGATIPFVGAVPATAIGGAMTPVTRALLGGTPTSLNEISSSATLDALLGKAAGDAALYAFKRQKPRTKGQVGETLSGVDSWLLADPGVAWQKARTLANGRKTIVDEVTAKGRLIESKAGSGARLSRNQRQAVREDLAGYTVKHWTDEDLRALAASMATSAGNGSRAQHTPTRSF